MRFLNRVLRRVTGEARDRLVPAPPAARHTVAQPEHLDATVVLVFCVYCGLPIRYAEGHGWVHTGPRGTFGCRDDLGQLTDTYAAPARAHRGVAAVPSALADGLILHRDRGDVA